VNCWSDCHSDSATTTAPPAAVMHVSYKLRRSFSLVTKHAVVNQNYAKDYNVQLIQVYVSIPAVVRGYVVAQVTGSSQSLLLMSAHLNNYYRCGATGLQLDASHRTLFKTIYGRHSVSVVMSRWWPIIVIALKQRWYNGNLFIMQWCNAVTITSLSSWFGIHGSVLNWFKSF